MSMLGKVSVLIGGIMFGFGLAFSGAAKPEVVLAFLRFEDLGLLFVIGVGLFVTAISFNVLPRIINSPLFGSSFIVKAKESISSRTIVGAIIFGVGWGVSGICPGTSIAALGMGNLPILYAIAGMFIGTFVYGSIRSNK